MEFQMKWFFVSIDIAKRKRVTVQYSSNTSRGFTLIELLVVIAIIGILASVVLASLQSTRERSRDALRKTQLSEIAKAIEMYHSDNGHYPRTSGWCTQISHPSYQASFWADIAPYMSAPVFDPLYAGTYQDYFYRNINDQSYYLYAELEGEDRSDDGISGCIRIDNLNNEYDYRYPQF